MRRQTVFESGILILILIFVVIVLTAGIVSIALQTDPIAEALASDPVYKLLFVLEHEGKTLGSYVLAFYPETMRAAMFDIPGNVGRIIENYDRIDRMDILYTEGSVVEYVEAIEKQLSIEIPFYITMSLDEFCRVADALSGLPLFLHEPVNYVDENGTKILLPGGFVTLDGSKLRTYILYKSDADPNPDAESVSRKQRAVLSFFNTIADRGSYFFSPKVYNKYIGYFHSNLQPESLQPLLAELSHMDVERIVPQRITGLLRDVDGQMLLFPSHDGQLFRDIVKQGLTTLASRSETDYERIYVIEILNGTELQGLARKTGELYQNFGFDVLRMANADKSDYNHTVVIDHIGNSDIANVVANLIQCKNIESVEVKSDESIDDEFMVDFTVILGEDFAGRYVR